MIPPVLAPASLLSARTRRIRATKSKSTQGFNNTVSLNRCAFEAYKSFQAGAQEIPTTATGTKVSWSPRRLDSRFTNPQTSKNKLATHHGTRSLSNNSFQADAPEFLSVTTSSRNGLSWTPRRLDARFTNPQNSRDTITTCHGAG